MLTKAKIARREGVSRVRVTQILSLLELHQDIKTFVIELTDAKAIQFFSERKLRQILSIPISSQQLQAWSEIKEQFKGQL